MISKNNEWVGNQFGVQKRMKLNQSVIFCPVDCELECKKIYPLFNF